MTDSATPVPNRHASKDYLLDWFLLNDWAERQRQFWSQIAASHGIGVTLQTAGESVAESWCYSKLFTKTIEHCLFNVVKRCTVGSTISVKTFDLPKHPKHSARRDADSAESRERSLRLEIVLTHSPKSQTACRADAAGATFKRILGTDQLQRELEAFHASVQFAYSRDRSRLAISIAADRKESWLRRVSDQFTDDRLIELEIQRSAPAVIPLGYMPEIDRTVQQTVGYHSILRVSELRYWVVPSQEFELNWLRQNLRLTRSTSRTDIRSTDLSAHARWIRSTSQLATRNIALDVEALRMRIDQELTRVGANAFTEFSTSSKWRLDTKYEAIRQPVFDRRLNDATRDDVTQEAGPVSYQANQLDQDRNRRLDAGHEGSLADQGFRFRKLSELGGTANESSQNVVGR